MLNVTILTIGKIREKYLQQAIGEYLARLAPYGKIKQEELKAEKFNDLNKSKALAIEGERLDSWLSRRMDSKIWLLQEKGLLMDSVSFSKMVCSESKSSVFVIAGALGFDNMVKDKYHDSLSLSLMTMPHEMARLVLLEQLYRAVTIDRGKTYHY